MKMDLKLDLDYKKWLPILRQAQPYVFGLLLIGVFAYTALIVNAALNVKANPIPPVTADAAASIKFDQATIDAIKKLDVVQGNVPTGDLGKSDPFN